MTISPRFREALAYAATIHADHLRKGTDIPYLSHLLAVTAMVLEHGGDEDEAIAALLHDAIEDHKATHPDIVSRFGEAVAQIVEGCTDTDKQPKQPWQQRKEEHIARLRASPRSVQLVVAADKLHNARSILADYRTLGESLWSRFNADRGSILWYHRSVADVLTLAPKPLIEELLRVVVEIEQQVQRGRTSLSGEPQ